MASPKPELPLGDTYFADSVGATLRLRRREMELSLAQVSRRTKIQQKLLAAIENNDWQQLPHTVHLLGFIRQYADLLGLDSQVATTKYLLERGPLTTDSGKRRRYKSPIVGSRIILRAAAAAIIIAMVIYLGFQLSILAAPPPLEVTSPPTDIRQNNTVIEVGGKTNTSASVSINGSAVTIDEDGRFNSVVNLAEGLNVVRVEARNRAGKVATIERTILVDSTSDR